MYKADTEYIVENKKLTEKSRQDSGKGNSSFVSSVLRQDNGYG